ncbi:MAG: peptidoglycan-associated lipoprotein Pal [Cardiobacteriaceae bacterium]|nr:peptidoglycan-associated lipoprotein Pal [Cardiobacteriaceae bacterium]
MKRNQFIGLCLFALWAFGCSSPYGLEGKDADAAANAGQDGSFGAYGDGATYGSNSSYGRGNASTADYYNDPQYGVNVVGGPNSSDKDRIIYFSYDSSSIDSRSEAVIREHAKYLRAHPETRVVLEGHTDERGTREYNIGLGERRAYSVKEHFVAAGISPQQMRVLSYGEERPASFGSSEQDYAKNRRAVIIY